MALITLVACIASEAIPLCPHINDSTLSQVVLLMLLLPNKSTVKYSLASHPHSILQHQSLSVSGCRGRVWRLKTTLRELVWEFTRANEVAEHIIRVDFDTRARSFWHLFLVKNIKEIVLVRLQGSWSTT